MNSMKTIDEFKIGNHNIGWMSDRFKEYFKEQTTVDKAPTPTFQKLPRSMKDIEIEYELKPGYSGLKDILAFLDNAPQECKDGNWNLFYTPSSVVNVYWSGDDWYLSTWDRDDYAWYGDERVFSPATESSITQLESSDTLPLELNINGITYKRV